MTDLKKPSEIANDADPLQRETGRITDLRDLDLPAKANYLPQNRTVCCCVDPYIDEEASVYKIAGDFREGDVFVHKAQFLKMTICINVCFTTEVVTETIIHKAIDGTIAKGIRRDQLSDIKEYILVKTDRCRHRHHDLKRYSTTGRILKFCCTWQGIISTFRKALCLEECTNTVYVRTLQCDRTLYQRRL